MLWPVRSRLSRMSKILPATSSKGDAEPGRMRVSSRAHWRSSILTPSSRPLVRLALPLTGARSTALAGTIDGICTTALPSKPSPKPLSPFELNTISALLLPGSLECLPLPPLTAHPTHSSVVACSTVAHRGVLISWCLLSLLTHSRAVARSTVAHHDVSISWCLL
jgi:hypothetical protein